MLKMENNLKIEGYELLSQKVYQVLKTEIVEALKRKDSEQADRLSRIHIDNVLINILENEIKEEIKIKRREIKSRQIKGKIKEVFLRANYHINLDLMNRLTEALKEDELNDENVIVDAFDPRVVERESEAVAKAAIESGVARI